MNGNKRSVLIFILGFITLGIANIVYMYWFSYKISKEHNDTVFLPVKEVVLNCLTIGIYGIFWTYKISSRLDKLDGSNGTSSTSIVCTIVSALPLRCITMTVIYQRLTALNEVTEL